MHSARNNPSRFIAALAGASLLLPFAGCHSKSSATPANFITGLNAHFVDHPECLFPDSPIFPFETTDPEKTKQMNALVAEQLLTVAEERDLHESRYVVTVAGARVAPRFCYGHRVVSTIDSSTPPVPTNGFPETHVAYHYTLEDVPVWAKAAGMSAAFPAMAAAISAPSADTATLAGTVAGWQVPE